MVSALRLNTSECNQLYNISMGFCEKGLELCERGKPGTPIQYYLIEFSLIAIGGVLIINGLVHAVIAIRNCRKGNYVSISDVRLIQGEAGSVDTYHKPDVRESVLKKSCVSVTMLVLALLPISISWFLSGLSKYHCPSRNVCPSVANSTVNGCVFLEKLAIEIIQNVIGVNERLRLPSA